MKAYMVHSVLSNKKNGKMVHEKKGFPGFVNVDLKCAGKESYLLNHPVFYIFTLSLICAYAYE